MSCCYVSYSLGSYKVHAVGRKGSAKVSLSSAAHLAMPHLALASLSNEVEERIMNSLRGIGRRR